MERQLAESVRQRTKVELALKKMKRIAEYCLPNNVNLTEATHVFDVERQKLSKACDPAALYQLHVDTVCEQFPATLRPREASHFAAFHTDVRVGDDVCAARSGPRPKPSLAGRHLLYLDLARAEEFRKAAAKAGAQTRTPRTAWRDPKKQLPAQLSARVERLYQGKAPPAFETEVVEVAQRRNAGTDLLAWGRGKLDEDTMEEATYRLCSEEVAHRRARRQQMAAEFYPVQPPRPVPPAEIDEMVLRHTEDVAQRHENMQQLQEKYYPRGPRQRLDSFSVAEMASRLSTPKTRA
eukprot:EG_transcript_14964